MRVPAAAHMWRIFKKYMHFYTLFSYNSPTPTHL